MAFVHLFSTPSHFAKDVRRRLYVDVRAEGITQKELKMSGKLQVWMWGRVEDVGGVEDVGES